MLKVEVVNIMPRKDGSSSVSLKICLIDNDEAELITFGPTELYKEETMTLAGLKMSVEAKIKGNYQKGYGL